MSQPAPNDNNINYLTARLHFIAKLKGQLSTTQGDTFHLLDDGNSFWWLVQNTSTKETGYVPAEILQTPRERLALANSIENLKTSQDIQSNVYSHPKQSKKITDSRSVRFIVPPSNNISKLLPPPPAAPPVPLKESTPITSFNAFKTPKWLSKIISPPRNDPAMSYLKLLRIYPRDFLTATTFKTIVLDELMTVSDLIKTSIVRFELQNDSQNYFITILKDENNHQVLENNFLLKTLFTGISTSQSSKTMYVNVYINQKNTPKKAKRDTHMGGLLASQKRLSQRLSFSFSDSPNPKKVISNDSSKPITLAPDFEQETNRISLLDFSNLEPMMAVNSLKESYLFQDKLENMSFKSETPESILQDKNSSINIPGRLRTAEELEISNQFNEVDLVAENTETLEILEFMQQNFNQLLSVLMVVEEALSHIRQKLNLKDTLDHGLLLQERNIWLDPTKTVKSYDLNYGDIIEFRKKNRVLKVKLLDSSVKSVMIDESLPLSKVIAAVCQKLGIANSDEYSFLPPTSTSEGDPSTRLSRDLSIENQNNKWLRSDKTLREQNCIESDVLLLKKKFFYSDQSINRDDHVQLGLLYNQAQEAIINGTYPCTFDESCLFAALQMQISFGNHEPDKHKKGFLTISNFIPAEYTKKKDVEKRIFQEHNALNNMSQLNAKFRYVQLSRSLKSYGITFFTVNERAPNKKSMIPVLLGISKNSVIKMNIETKQILQEWKLTQIRRWANTSKSFTLDFGDFSDSYYSVETDQGEAISQQISGYIDIIINNRKERENKAKEALGIEARRISMKNVPQNQRNSIQSKNSGFPVDNAYDSYVGLSKNPQILELQKSLLQNIDNGIVIGESAKLELSNSISYIPNNDDSVNSKWKNDISQINAEIISSLVTNQLYAISCILIYSTGNVEDMDYNVLGQNVASMIGNLRQMMKSVKIISSLQSEEDSSHTFKATASKIIDSFIQIFSSLKPILLGEYFMDNLYTRTSGMADASSHLLIQLSKLGVSEDRQEEIILLAEKVATHAITVEEKINDLCKFILDPLKKQELQNEAYNMMEIASMLVAVCEVLSPVLDFPKCKDQFLEVASLLAESLQFSQAENYAENNKALLKSLNGALEKTSDTLIQLVDKVKNEDNFRLDKIEIIFENVLSWNSKILENTDKKEIITESAQKLLSEVVMLKAILKDKSEDMAEDRDKFRFNAYINDLNALEEDMISMMKPINKKWDEKETKDSFFEALENLRDKIEFIAAPYIMASASQKLIKVFKNSIVSTNQLISSSKYSGASNRDQQSQMNVLGAIKNVYTALPSVIQNLSIIQTDKDDDVARVVLIKDAESFISAVDELIVACRYAVATISDSACQGQLKSAIEQCHDDMELLKENSNLAEHLIGKDLISSALMSLLSNQKKIQNLLSNPANLESDEFIDSESLQISISNHLNNLETLFKHLKCNGNEKIKEKLGGKSIDIVSCYQKVTFQTIQLCGADQNFEVTCNLLSSLDSLGGSLEFLLQEFQKFVHSNIITEHSFESIVAEVISAIESFTDFLPSIELFKQLIDNLQGMSEKMEVIWSESAPSSNEKTQSKPSEIKKIEKKLEKTALELSETINALSTAPVSSTDKMLTDIDSFEMAYTKLITEASELANCTFDAEFRKELQTNFNQTSIQLLKYVEFIKKAMLNPSNADLQDSLICQSQIMNSKVQTLLDSFSLDDKLKYPYTTAIGNLDQCFSIIQKVNRMLKVNQSYETIVGEANSSAVSIKNKIKDLISIMKEKSFTNISLEIYSTAVNITVDIKELTLASTRAAIFVAHDDPKTIPYVDSILDSSSVFQATQNLIEANKRLGDEKITRSFVLNTAQDIAKYTSIICNIAKSASKNPLINSEDQKQFFDHAKSIATNTATLVTSLKELAINQSYERRQDHQASSKGLIDAILLLNSFCYLDRFSGAEIVLGARAASKQLDLLEDNRILISKAKEIVVGLKLMHSEPDKVANAPSKTSTPSTIDKLIKINNLGNCVEKLVTTILECGPLHLESDNAMKILQKSTLILYDAILKEAPAKNGIKDPTSVIDTMETLASLVQVIYKYADTDYEQIVSSIENISTQFMNGALYSVDVASTFPHEQRILFLETCKKLGESLQEYVTIIQNAFFKAVPGSSKRNLLNDFGIQERIFDIAHISSTVVGQLVGLKTNESSEFKAALVQIEKTMMYLEEMNEKFVANETFIDYETGVCSFSSQLNELVDAATQVFKNPEACLKTVNQFPGLYINIANLIQGAACTSSDVNLKPYLRQVQRNLGGLLLKFIESIRNSDEDQLIESAKNIRKITQSIRETLQFNREGFTKAVQVTGNISSLISNLQETLKIVDEGQLNSTNEDDSFATFKDGIIVSITKLSEIIPKFDLICSNSPNEIDMLALNMYQVLLNIKNECLKGAASISSNDQDLQVFLIQTVKRVAESLEEVMKVSCKYISHESDSETVNESIEQALSANNDLLDIVEDISNQNSTNIRTIENVISSLQLMISQFHGNELEFSLETLAYIVDHIESIRSSTTTILNACKSKCNSVSALHNFKLQFDELRIVIKSFIENEATDIKKKVSQAFIDILNKYIDFFNALKTAFDENSVSNAETSNYGVPMINEMLDSFAILVSRIDPHANVNMDDPNFKNEKDIVEMAFDLENSGKSIVDPGEEASENTLNNHLCKTSRNIAFAASSLLKASVSRQREIVVKGRKLPVKDAIYFSDGTWSEGIISASKNVGISAKLLCSKICTVNPDNIAFLSMIASGKQVSASTIQILTAASVHVDPNSSCQKKLSAATKNMMKIIEDLITLCEDSIIEENCTQKTPARSRTELHTAEIEANIDILKLEKELNKARVKLSTVRKSRYGSFSGSSPMPENEYVKSETQNTASSVRRASMLSVVKKLEEATDVEKKSVLKIVKQLNMNTKKDEENLNSSGNMSKGEPLIANKMGKPNNEESGQSADIIPKKTSSRKSMIRSQISIEPILEQEETKQKRVFSKEKPVILSNANITSTSKDRRSSRAVISEVDQKRLLSNFRV